MEGEIIQNDNGTQTLDVPSVENITEVDRLKADSGFMECYLSGDKVAVAQMGAAIKGESTRDTNSEVSTDK